MLWIIILILATFIILHYRDRSFLSRHKSFELPITLLWLLAAVIILMKFIKLFF